MRRKNSPRRCVLGLLLLAASFTALELAPRAFEGSLPLRYPSPAGVYSRVTTLGRTLLALDSGGVGIGGTPYAQAALDLRGLLRLGSRPALPALPSPTSKFNGSLYYDSGAGRPMGLQGGKWKKIEGTEAVFKGESKQVLLPPNNLPVEVASLEVRSTGGMVFVTAKVAYRFITPAEIVTCLYRGAKMLDCSSGGPRNFLTSSIALAENLPAGSHFYRLIAQTYTAGAVAEAQDTCLTAIVF